MLFSWYCVSQTQKRRDTLLCNQTQRGIHPISKMQNLYDKFIMYHVAILGENIMQFTDVWLVWLHLLWRGGDFLPLSAAPPKPF